MTGSSFCRFIERFVSHVRATASRKPVQRCCHRLGAADGQFEILESSDGPVAPQAWNQFEPSSKGFACDWTDAAKGEKLSLIHI